MINDVPSPIDLQDRATAEQWAQEAAVKRPYRAAVFQHIANILKTANVTKVLELGSGPGFFAEVLLKTLPNVRYTAFDFSEPMHQLAKIRLGKTSDSIDFITGSFLATNWAEHFCDYDAVVSIQAVHEIRHKLKTRALFLQILSTLKPGGVFNYCDHVADEGGMSNTELYMNETEQNHCLVTAGFISVNKINRLGSLALWEAYKRI